VSSALPPSSQTHSLPVTPSEDAVWPMIAVSHCYILNDTGALTMFTPVIWEMFATCQLRAGEYQKT
jgi:hypothetical protein